MASYVFETITAAQALAYAAADTLTFQSVGVSASQASAIFNAGDVTNPETVTISTEGFTLKFGTPIEGETEKHDLTPENGFVGEIKHYVECIEAGKTPEQSLYEGVTVLKIILGGYQSEKEKRVVTL